MGPFVLEHPASVEWHSSPEDVVLGVALWDLFLVLGRCFSRSKKEFSLHILDSYLKNIKAE